MCQISLCWGSCVGLYPRLAITEYPLWGDWIPIMSGYLILENGIEMLSMSTIKRANWVLTESTPFKEKASGSNIKEGA